MSKVFVSDINLSNIADAIRAKNGAQTQYYPRDMAAAITALTIEERHVPVQVNIQQSQNQTIKVKVKQKELKTTTVSTDIRIPETFQLEATVTADNGYTPGMLNHSLVDVEWGDTVVFNATAATRLNPTITYNVLSVQPVSVGNANVKYIFTGPSAATTYNLTDNRTISVPTLNNNETYEQIITYYVTEADIFEGSVDISITNAASGITTSITLETEEPTSQLTVARNGASNNSIIVTNTGNLTLYDISIDCTNSEENITYQSIAPGENQVITLDSLTYTFETVSIEATSPDPDNPDYTLEQTIYFDPTLLDIHSYASSNNISRSATELSSNQKADLTNRIIDTDATRAFENRRNLRSLGNVETTWNTSNVTDMEKMFYDCSSLTSLDTSNWSFSNGVYMSEMFHSCSSLTSLDTSNWNVTLLSAYNMFYNCGSLTSLDLSNWDISNLGTSIGTNTQALSNMFRGCRSLTVLDLSSWTWPRNKRLNLSGMFNSCTNLRIVDLTGFDSCGADPISSMFYGCNNLEYIILNCEPTTAMTKTSTEQMEISSNTKILVPRSAINTYKAYNSSGYISLWGYYANQIYAIENYTITKSNGQVTVTPNS